MDNQQQQPQQNAPNPVVVPNLAQAWQEFVEAGARFAQSIVSTFQALAEQVRTAWKGLIGFWQHYFRQPKRQLSCQSRAFLKTIRTRERPTIVARPRLRKKPRSYRKTILAEPGLVVFFDGDMLITNRAEVRSHFE